MNDPIIAISGSDYSALEKMRSTVNETCALLDRQLGIIKDQKALINKQQTIIEIMSGYINDNLELFEQLFESDEGFCDASPEQMSSYIVIARWMESRYGRKCIADRVEKHMKELPF